VHGAGGALAARLGANGVAVGVGGAPSADVVRDGVLEGANGAELAGAGRAELLAEATGDALLHGGVEVVGLDDVAVLVLGAVEEVIAVGARDEHHDGALLDPYGAVGHGGVLVAAALALEAGGAALALVLSGVEDVLVAVKAADARLHVVVKDGLLALDELDGVDEGGGVGAVDEEVLVVLILGPVADDVGGAVVVAVVAVEGEGAREAVGAPAALGARRARVLAGIAHGEVVLGVALAVADVVLAGQVHGGGVGGAGKAVVAARAARLVAVGVDRALPAVLGEEGVAELAHGARLAPMRPLGRPPVLQSSS